MTAVRGPSAALRVGLFGHLGGNNIGNDASMEAILRYLKNSYPEATLDAMCTGPETVRDRYGIRAVAIVWHQKYEQRVPGITVVPLKIIGKGVDAIRMALWVRRHDVVIVPGMGILEASLPLRPWGIPYALFLLCASGRLFGTKVALVSVGAGVVSKRLTRWLTTSAARLAAYRSYRDTGSREAMRQRGLDITRDHVYPDVAFSLPVPPLYPGDAGIVGVGVMAFYGSNDDRKRADEIYSSYVTEMKRFVRWLVDNGRRVRLFIGDTNGSDDSVVQEILADLRESRPDLDPSFVTAAPVSTFADIMQAMLPVGSVVAIRFHNLVSALKLCKPTISISYSAKHNALLADMGLADFCRPVDSLELDLLVDQFRELESRSAQLRQILMERNKAVAQLLDKQFDELSAALFPAAESWRNAADYKSAHEEYPL
jgi:polysaccharide pyruvyl transferase WcaK-like protein